MSKKSRKRNKKILAAIGLGLGAMALSKRKKANANVEMGLPESDMSNYENEGSLVPAKKPVSKPDSKMPGNLSKDMGKDNAQQKPRFGQVINKEGNIQTLRPLKNSGLTFGVSDRKVDRTANAVNKANRDMEKGKLPPQLQNPGRTNITTDQGKTRNFFKKLGNTVFPKANFKSGGRVKGCGKALRGFGKAMKGKR